MALKLLQSIGYSNVKVAGNGVEALQLMEKFQFDVILMVQYLFLALPLFPFLSSPIPSSLPSFRSPSFSSSPLLFSSNFDIGHGNANNGWMPMYFRHSQHHAHKTCTYPFAGGCVFSFPLFPFSPLPFSLSLLLLLLFRLFSSPFPFLAFSPASLPFLSFSSFD